MNTLSTPAKRSSYPFSVVLILLAHLVLGYMIYQQVAQPDRVNPTASKTIVSQKPAKPAIP